MDFLKYLDVIIGLSVVMVLLSPLVTAVTHAVLWWTSSRSKFLEQALQRLIVQLEGHPTTIVSVRDRDGNPVANAEISNGKGTRIAVLGANGDSCFSGGLPPGSISRGKVDLKIVNAPPGSTLLVRRIPQQSPEPQIVCSEPTNADGQATVSYRYDGHGLFSSPSATLVVKDADGQQVPAQVTWRIGTETGTVTVPASERSAAIVRPLATPADPGETLPPPPRLCSACDLKLIVQTPAGVAAPGLVVEAEFPRNEQFDRVLGPEPIGPDGVVHLDTSAMTTAEAVVRHPMVARVPISGPWSRIPPVKNVKAECVEREELIRILLELAAGEGGTGFQLEPAARESLKRLLAMNEIPDPAGTLSAIRTQAQELEHKEPHLALHVRHAKAIVHAANTAFVGKINGWFDAAMARATQQYTARARFVTVVAAFFVAIVLQFNSIDLLQRLSTDTTFRTSLVEMAKVEQARIDSMASAPAGDNSGELELLKARRQEIDAHLATLRTPELSILPDHLLWQSVPRGRVSRDPLWRGPYPNRLQLVAGGTTFDIRPAWRDDYLMDLYAAIEASGAPVSVGLVRGSEFLVLRAERPFVPMLFTADEEGASFRDVPGTPAGAVAEADLRITDEWPVDKARLGPMQLMMDSTPVRIALGTDAAPVIVDRTTAMGRAALMGRLRDALSREAPALRVDIRCERNRRAVRCPADEATAAGVDHVLVLSAKTKAVRDIRLLSDPADPFSNLLEDVERRPTGWRIAASDLPTADRSRLRLFAYDRQGDAPDALDSETRFVQIAPLPPTATGQQAPVVTASDGGAAPTTRFIRRPAAAVAVGPQGSPVERIAHSLNAELRANRAARNGASEGWPHALTAERVTDDQLVLTSSRVGPLELRYAPGRPETNILGRPLERVRPWTEWASSESATGFFDGIGNAFGPHVLGILLSWALLSLGAPFWFDALKNALKLRPSAAVTEERNSRERQEHNVQRAAGQR